MTQTIFHVDDEARVTASVYINLHRTLMELGVELTSFSDPRKLIETIDQNGMPTVIMTDDRMPGMTGCELAIELRQRGFTGQIVMLSGDTDVADAELCGINTMLVKPCATRDLVPVLKAALR
jgi:FixJ family two-component response regulator